jgi:hypothetical protein
MSYKLTKDKALDLLKSIGVDVELVDNDADISPDFDANAAIALIDGARSPIIEQKVKGTLNADIHKSVTKKVYSGLAKKIVALTGIDAKDLEGKEADEMLDLGLTHLNTTTGGDKAAFAAQLKDVMKAHEAAVAKINADKEAEVGTLREQLSQKQILDLLQGSYKTAKGIAPEADLNVLSSDYLNWLKTSAIVKVSADGKEIELYDKTNPETRLLNESKNGFAKIDDKMKEYHTPRGQWNEDARKVNAVDAMKSRVSLDTTINKDGKMETGLDKQLASMEAWANQS